jgi:hypothetical protein
VIFACLRPHLMQRILRAKALSSTNPASVTASAAWNVRHDPQWLQSTFRPQPKRTRSPVVRTCFVDIYRGQLGENVSGTG